jgi:two-component system OmpR family response regulator
MNNNSEEKRVLLVDDDGDFVKILELYLRLSGLDVSCASCGKGALEELRLTAPSVVILDLLMPDIDGAQVCRYLRQDLGDKETPVIVLTALSDSKHRREMLQAGADEYFTKPCDLGLIYRTVERYTS